MTHEKSCGAVVFTKTGDKIKYLLISNLDGIYGFPKGHTNGDETEVETAIREVFEETNVKFELIDGFKKTDEYLIPPKNDTTKQVIYFLGKFQNQNVVYQIEELSGAYLVSYAEAKELLQFESLKHILKEADDYIRKTNC